MKPVFARIIRIFCLVVAGGMTGVSSDAQEPAASAAIRQLLTETAGAQFEPLQGDWQLSLPADHGAHPMARAESWGITAQLTAGDGAPVTVTFALARYGLRPALDRDEAAPWAFTALFGSQATLLDHRSGRLRSEERFSRGGGAAGSDPAAREIWIDGWTLSYGTGPAGDGLTLEAVIGDIPVLLSLAPVKPPVATDAEASGPTRGFILPRLTATGTIGAGEDRRDVSGIAWLDRLWGDVPVPGGPLAYDRLLLHLSDGSDISVLRTHRSDRDSVGTIDALVIDRAGTPSYLDGSALDLGFTRTWRAPDGGPVYPVGWRITGAGLDLTVSPVIDDQRQGFALPVWLGAVRVEGTRDGVAVDGTGTLLLAGSDDD